MVEEPVEDSRGDHLVAEDVAPFGDGLIGGEQDAAALVPAGDELEEDVGAGALEGEIAQLVDQRSFGLA